MKRKKVVLYILVLLLVIAFLLRFEGIAGIVAKTLGTNTETVTSIGNTLFYGGLGAFLVYSGIALMAMPLVGVPLIIIGGIMCAIPLYEYFSRKKPDNTQIDIYKK
jgi:ABC-type phosphate transport system permease subunit